MGQCCKPIVVEDVESLNEEEIDLAHYLSKPGSYRKTKFEEANRKIKKQ
jgi:hypothetical protein